MVSSDCDKAMKSNGVVASKYGHTHPQRWLQRDRIALAMRTTSSHWNLQSTFRNTEDDRKILLQILSNKIFTITSLFHLRQYSWYVFEHVDKISICPPEDRPNFPQSRLLLQRAGFNPYLSHAFILNTYRGSLLRHTTVHIFRVVTLWSVFRRATLGRRGRVVSSDVYGKRLSLGKDKERMSLLDRRLYIIQLMLY